MAKPTRSRDPQRPSAPAADTALEWLRLRLGENAWRDGERLPTLAGLAASAGVSRAAMSRATQRMAAEGKLTVRRRLGIVAGKPATAENGRPARQPEKWQRLKGQLEYDLYDGAYYDAGVLPAAKVLQEHYGVDFRTLRKALQALLRERVLRLHKRAYRVARPEDQNSGNAVVFVTPQELRETRYRSFPDSGDLIRLLESECGRRKLQFRPQAVSDWEAFRRGLRTQQVLGGLCYHTAQYGREVYDEFAGLKIPVALFDNYNHAQRVLPAEYLSRNRMRVIQFDEVFAGNEVGRFLLRLGHRRIAFISPFHGDWVYPIRCESVRRAFEPAGPGNRLELVGVNNLREGLQRRATEALERRRQQSGGGDSGLYRELLAMGLDEGTDEILRGWAAESVSWNVNAEHVFSAVLHRELQPLFEQALRLSGVTAWVCANDGVAIHALRFLRHRKVPVPETLSVVGFDNTGDASYNSLTSYDFDVSAAALKMLDHILRPEAAQFGALQRVVNSEGMVIARGTSGPARRL
jgi:DNA-binding LacI/PurR family transcriptional regulator